MHVLLLVNGYVTPHDAVYGAKFRVQARSMREAGYTVGVMACNQKFGDRLHQPVLGEPWVVRHDDDGIPVYFDYAWRLIPRVPKVSKAEDVRLRVAMAARVLETYVAQHGQPEVIHAHGVKWSGVVAAFLKTQFGVPYVLTEHTSMYPRRLVHDWQESLFLDAFARADIRTVVSGPFGEILEERIGAVAKPWCVVPNLVDEIFVGAETTFGRDDGGFHFFNAGRMNAVKGQADMIEAFAMKFRHEPRVRLRIAGDGDLRSELESLVADRGVADRVDFLGQISRERVAEEMQQCDAYVQSSHFETFAIPLIEATACGKPVVATACGGPESIVDDTNGILVEAGNVGKLGNAMDTLRRNIDQYDAAIIRQRCLARYAPEAVTAQYGELFLSAAGAGTP